MAVFRAGNTTASRESGSPEQAMYSTEAPFLLHGLGHPAHQGGLAAARPALQYVDVSACSGSSSWSYRE